MRIEGLVKSWNDDNVGSFVVLSSTARQRLDAADNQNSLHQRDEFQQLILCVNNAAKSILRFLRIGQEALEITGCWATVLAKGANHKGHSHPNNFLSGVYYVRIRSRRT